jgi:hypothetical protein
MKTRTINELRQEKEFGYKNPVSQKNNQQEIDLVKTYKTIQDLANEYPNDADLGRKTRTLLISLGLYQQKNG